MQSKIDLNDYSTNLNKLKSSFTLPSFKIVNNRTVNSTFDVLTGEFLSQKEDLIDVRFKEYHVEDLEERNDPHLLSTKKKRD